MGISYQTFIVNNTTGGAVHLGCRFGSISCCLLTYHGGGQVAMTSCSEDVAGYETILLLMPLTPCNLVQLCTVQVLMNSYMPRFYSVMSNKICDGVKIEVVK